MLTYDKVETEKYNLDLDIRNLSAFISSTRFKDLSTVSGLLLQEQYKVMITYSAILGERLKHLDKMDISTKLTNEGGM